MKQFWRPSKKTGSLRNELLTRSLFILAALLLLIGFFQYVVMKDFLYRSKAESLQSQIMSLPRGIDFSDGTARFSEPPGPLRDESSPSSSSHAEAAAPGYTNETAEPSDDRIGGSSGDPASSQRSMMERPSFLLAPDTSLAVILQENGFVDLGADAGTAAPQLSEEEYSQILEDLKARKDVPYKVIENSEGVEQLVVFRPMMRGPGVEAPLIQMGLETSSMQEVLVNQLVIFTVLALLALVAGLLVYLPVLRRTLIPLSNIVAAVERTDAGNLGERLPPEQGQAEIDRLARSFNSMLNRLEQSFASEREAKEQMRRFVADASHELRTPLTSIHGFVEVLRRGAADHPEQRSTALRSMYGETKRLNALVEDLLMLAKLDQTPQLVLRPVRLDQLIADMEPQLALLAGMRTLRLELQPQVTILCDADKIKQALLNLYHNAVQHTDPQSGVVTIALHTDSSHAQLAVCDNGAGIKEEHQGQIFERFYRSDSSRTRKYGGSGLGLAITQSIVEAHHGAIWLSSAYGEGSTFHISLPLQLPGGIDAPN